MNTANMTGLTNIVMTAAASVAATGTTMKIGVWDGTAWTDALVSSFGGALPLTTPADRTIPLATAFPSVTLSQVSKMRLTFTGTGPNYIIDDISLE
jgi:hypothetical protein